MSSQQWTPCAKLEKGKLAPKESDWNLAGSSSLPATRTRGQAKRRDSSSSSSDSSGDDGTWYHQGDDELPRDHDISSSDLSEERPTPTRMIVEVNQVKRLLEEFSSCRVCGGPLECNLSAKGYGLATKIEMSCLDRKCSFVHHGERPAATKIHENDDKMCGDRLTDYAVNCIYVLAFLACGDGPSEAEKLLGLLGLPNDTTMGSTTFKRVEQRIGPLIWRLTQEILLENVNKEVKETAHHESDFEQWERSINKSVATAPLPRERYPRIRASYDHGWQQKGSGHQHDSPSGHGVIFGHETRLPLAFEVKSKICDYCNLQRKRHPHKPKEEYKQHECTINFEGSSGSMEAASLLDLVIRLDDLYNVQVGTLCCDDDSSVRADCQWNNETYLRKHNTTTLPQVKITRGKNKGQLQDRPDKGKLPEFIDEPTFVSDPNHRGKLFTGELYQLKESVVATKATVTRMDTTRLGKNFKYMARSLVGKHPDAFEDCGKAVLEHHFDNHTYCDPAWCKRKNATERQRQKSKKYYRTKEKDEGLYKKIQAILAKYITKERLSDIAHGMDTNANEAFNNTVSWLAPKNRVYSGSRSLWHRICIAIGIVSLGPLEYYKRLFKIFGIQMTPNVLHYLKVKDGQRSRRLAKAKTQEKKLARNKRKFEILQDDIKIAKKERLQRAGKYKRGMNLDITAEDEEALPVYNSIKKDVPICPHPFCRMKGHKTTKAKACKANPERLVREGTTDACAAAVLAAKKSGTTPAVEQALADNDLAMNEAVPLQDSDEDSSLAMYQEAETWSVDEEGNAAFV